MMTDAAEVERAMLTVCNDHYARTRRIPTALAVPIGFVQRLATGVYGFQGPVNRMVLYYYGAPVSLEELESLTYPTVLSDRPR